MFDFNKTLSNGTSRLQHIQNMRDFYDQPAVFYPAENRRQWLDIPYGTGSTRQKLNIYTPLGEGPFPVIIWVHGGGWYTGDRSDRWLSCGLRFVQHGFALVSIGYRLADEAVFPQPVEDVAKGIEYIESYGAEYGLNTQRMGICGGSAGANIAAHACLRHKGIKAAQLNCAPLDFSAYREQYAAAGFSREASGYPDEDTSYEALYLGGTIEELPQACEKSNPANYLSVDAPYFLLVHGTRDLAVPYQQSVEFVNAVRKVTRDEAHAELILIEGGDHDSPMNAFEQELDFFNKHLMARP